MGCVYSAKKTKTFNDELQADQKGTANIQPVFRVDIPASFNENTPKPAQQHPRRPATEQKDSRVFRKYELKTLIGEGSFSRVWMVESRLTKQPYAMKITKGVEGKYIYDTELSILSRIRHPYVVQLIETFETGSDRYYTVLELATGGDLFDRVLRQPSGHFAEPAAARVLRMVLEGVAYLHGLGITHRDLKPDNLLFYHPGQDSRILISDFSVAHLRPSNGDRFMRTGCGTAEYLAPEVLDRKLYTSAVDMWAVGVVAYVVLSGTFPFDDEDGDAVDKTVAPVKLYRLILSGVFSFCDEAWNEVSDSARDFIKQLLVVEPQKRLTAIQALDHPWMKSCVIKRDGCQKREHLEVGRCSSSTSSNTDSIGSSTSSESSASHQPHYDDDLLALRQLVMDHLLPHATSHTISSLDMISAKS